MSGVTHVPSVGLPVRSVSWAELDAAVDLLADALALRVDASLALVGLFQGGWIVAQLLADRFPEARILGSTSKRQCEGFRAALICTEDDAPEDAWPLIRKRQVVLVDEVVESGRTMLFHAEQIGAALERPLLTAALFSFADTLYSPDLVAEQLPRRTNLILPWRKRRDVALRSGAGA